MGCAARWEVNPWVQLGIGAAELVAKLMQGARKGVVKIKRIRSRKAENDAFAAQVRADAEKARKP